MRIYIPEHLRKVGIFRDLTRMIAEYEKGYEDPTGSFDSYQSYMKIDPVIRFIGFCISSETIQDYQVVLEYITRLFYSVRGTRKVFDYMSRYLRIEFIGEPVYTTKSVSFSIKNNPEWSDISLFNRYLTEFLEYLLYYESLSYNIEGLGLTVSDDLDFYCGIGAKTFKRYEI